MITSYFVNLENIVILELMKATQTIEAAVAWINFDIYGPVLKEAVGRGVKLTILINNDDKNKRYIEFINQLNFDGEKIKFVKFGGIMHHKFCVVDRKICMFGSFNWTKNANKNNIEDLNICDDIGLINSYLLELEALCNLDKNDMMLGSKASIEP